MWKNIYSQIHVFSEICFRKNYFLEAQRNEVVFISWCFEMHCCSACILSAAGEMLSVAEHFLEQQMHPTVVISAYRMALDDMVSTLKRIRYGAGLDMGSVGGLDGLVCSE